MGLSVTLVNVTPNELVYLVTNVNPPETSITITAAGVAGPSSSDLVLDCANDTWGRAAAPRLRQVCNAGLNGLGNVAAGAWTQVQARDLLSGDGSTQAGGKLMPRAELSLQPLSERAGGVFMEAEPGASGGNPTIVITASADTGESILRVRLRSTPGVR